MIGLNGDIIVNEMFNFLQVFNFHMENNSITTVYENMSNPKVIIVIIIQ